MRKLMKLPPSPESLCSALDRHATERADQLAVRFLHDGEVGGRVTELTFAAFRREALRVASALQEFLRPGDRALLLYEGGLEFITAFYGCLYAGVIAVPSYPPDPRRLHRTLPRLQAIVEDAGAKLVLCTSELMRAAQPLCAQADRLSALDWLATDALDPRAALASPVRSGPQDLAYLQYTSGSTGTPKGVMVTHDNLAWICGDLLARENYVGPCHHISWLPTFHDLGLIWGLLTPLVGGFPVTFMLPAAFLQRPARWLQAITHFRGTHTAAPNFAYELCVSKIADELLPQLELSCLRAAMNAAEPVRPSTLAAFQRRFGPVGLRAGVQTPAYGLAEATLQVSLCTPEVPPILLPSSISALEQQRIAPPVDRADTRVLVGCGQVASFSRLAIVDPQTRQRLAEGRVGEIWVASPVVARGYWGQPAATAETFASRIAGEDDALWLRTGDLGFLAEGQLFISGRAKDVLIVRGRNLYPQDLELEVEAVHPAIRPGCAAAFPIEVAGEERIGLVAELDPERLAGMPAEELLPLLRRAIAEGFDVLPHELALIPPRSIFKTSSGKIQRRRTAAALAAGELTVLARWTAPRPAQPAPPGPSPPSGTDLQARITEWLREVPEFVQPSGALPDVPFQELGLDSASMVGMSGRLAELLGRPLPPTLLFDHPTLRALVAHLSGETAAPAVTPGPAALPHEPIAIVGLSCRFPGGGTSPQAFWEALRNRVDAVCEATGRRWAAEQTPGEPPRPELRWAGLLDSVDGFDAAFFGISAREAVSLDPQQRLLLEVAWEALEDAGLPREQLLGSPTGVFIGIANLDYQRLLAQGSEPADMYTLTGNLMSTAAGRLAYFFGLQGPCISVDTACSSSLTAIHLACQSLRRGESRLAVAGGVNLILSPWGSVLMAAAQAVSPDGRCKTFDASANGMVRAEGCGLVVLKRLSDAQRDGDRIWALVRGSAVNQDGQSAGLTVPSGLAQQALLRAALADAGVAPAQVSYVETHGTGTVLGDPIEVEALKAVLGQPRADGSRCVLGAVKSNLGHLEAAAGVAGLIKAVLALHHRAIPANLHLQTVNPRLPLADTPFVLPREELAWTSPDAPRIAGVSSFGISGTNVHVVLEEAPQLPAPAAAPARAQVLPLSARSPEALQSLIAAYKSWLTAPAARDGSDLAELAHTASVRRSHHPYRVAVVGSSPGEWAQALQAASAAAAPPGAAGAAPQGARPRLAFVFSGHGAQWLGMGRQLVQQEPVFRAALHECDVAIRHQAGWSVLDELHADDGALGRDRLDVIQPALFAIQVALAALWRAWGVQPDAVVGHSLGEITAAHVAGALSLEQAARILCRRGELLMRLKGQGVMALVELPYAQAQQAIAGRTDQLAVAVCNSPSATVLSGAAAAMEQVLAELEGRGIGCRRLKWAVAAGHSPQVDALLPELRAALVGLRPAALRMPLFSTVTAGEIDAPALDGEYWLRNLREPVQLAQTLRCMQDRGYDLFLELSPHPILAPAIAETLEKEARSSTVLPSLRRGEEERRALLESLAVLYERGFTPSWQQLHPDGGRCVSLPAYPFQRRRYWFGADADSPARPSRAASPTAAGQPLLGPALTSAVQPERHFWEQPLSVQALPYLADHRVQGEVIFPAAGYLEMALAAAAAVYGAAAHAVEELTLEQLLALPGGATRAVQTVLTEQGPDRAELQIWSREGASFVRHATATVRRAAEESAVEAAPLRQLQQRCPTHLSGLQHYQLMRQRGAAYGPAFQGVAELWLGTDEALGRVQRPTGLPAGSGAYQFHPGFLDSCLQVMTALLGESGHGPSAALLPTGLSRLCLYRPPQAEVWVHARRRPAASGDTAELTADLVVLDQAGKLVAEVSGLQARPLEPDLSLSQESRWLYCRKWQHQEPALSGPLPPNPPGVWLLLADHGGTGAALAELLRARGHRCVVVLAAPPGAHRQADSQPVDPRDPEAWRRILKAELAESEPCAGVVHLWSLDATAVAETTEQTLAADQDLGCLSALHLVQALLATRWRQPPRLHLVTRGAQAAGSSHPGLAVAQAPLWGLGRVLNLEHPELRCRCIDLNPEAADTEAAALLAELLRDDREEQVALRAAGRYVARLVKTTLAEKPETAAAPEPAQGRPFRLEIREPGVLERLTLYPLQRRPPGPGEVELAVAVAGLNFQDVLAALGMLQVEPMADPSGRPRLGGECAGTVTAVGDGVVDLRPGQQVLAFCPGRDALASLVTTRHELVLPKPPELSFTQAATIPAVYLTAYYALAHVGRLAKGERVLIHAGSGGVGLAAIQYAQHVGAEIFATAGSAAKRDFLRSLGVPHVLDSRSLRFADEIRRITGGEGVDVVLNSLAGEFIAQSLGLLRRFGRFVEIGVRDYLQDSRLGLKPFLNGLSFTLIELVQLGLDRPALVRRLLQEVLQLFAAGVFRPLPCQTFPISQAAAAFAQMAGARHIGKLALTLHDSEARIVRAPPEQAAIRGDACYLITGGLGGLGLGLARWLVERGARHLVLVSRGTPTAAARSHIAALEQAGAQVLVAAVDVSQREEVAALLLRLYSVMPPLRGIIHAAAVLADGTVPELSAERFRAPLGPKVLGAWNLHALTLEQPLDFFVMYSSAALLLGSPGQANYAAGNAFLDALAQHRRQLGRCGMSIAWGPFSAAGGAAREERGERLAARGLASLTPEQGQELLGRLLQRSRPQLGVMDFALEKWLASYPSEAESPFLSTLRRELRAAGDSPTASDLTQQLQAALPAERQALLEAHLAEQLGRVLRQAANELDRQAPFANLGLDSLMSLELRNRLASSLGHKLTATILASHPSITKLAAHLVTQLGLGSVAAADSLAALRADAGLDLEVCPALSWSGPERPPTRILLTGATGFLGAYLLQQLLMKNPCEIACLVRAPDLATGHARLRQALARHELWRPEYGPRLIPILGDLARPRLGLSSEDFAALARSVDEIYHNGACIDWHEAYAGLRAVNVLGTEEVVRLCAQHRIKPLHYVSSLATLAPLMAAGGVLRESDEPDWQERDFNLLNTGYIQSKWVAEKKVLLARSRGLPVAVYRPGFITGDSRRGAWVAPDFFYDLIKGCIQLGCAPAWNAFIGIIAVDWEAQAIAHIARQPGCHGKTFHLLGQLGRPGAEELSYAGLWAYIRKRGYPLEEVPHATFYRALKQAADSGLGRDLALRSYVPHLQAPLFTSARKLKYDCTAAREYLQQADLQPLPTEQLLDLYFDQLEASGFLSLPPLPK
jgi:polyketide synthase 12/epothilone polyketide synthase D